MVSQVNVVKIKEYFHYVINQNAGLIPRGATNLRIFNLSKIGSTVNNVYSFSLVYSYKSRDVKLDLILKLFDNTEQCQRICQKKYLIMKKLNEVNFPIPRVYFMENDERFLGGPFVIMEKIEGRTLYSIKHRSEREIYAAMSSFAKTLAHLHELELDDAYVNVLAKPSDEYAYARKSALVEDQLGPDEIGLKMGAKYWGYEWITRWLETNAEMCACSRYSLVKGDMNLKNFIITDEGKIFFLDWEWAEIGDALKDAGNAYHEIRHVLGPKFASYFLKKYVRNSKIKVEHSRLRFYIVASGLRLAIFFKVLSTKRVGDKYFLNMFGMKYRLFFPLIRWHFKRRCARLEKFLKSYVLNYEEAMFGTPGAKIMSSMEIQDVSELLNAVSSDIVLDVGTGSGRIARNILSTKGGIVVGVDYREAIMSAKHSTGDLSGYELVIADGQYLPFKHNSFDAVVCIRTLKYFRNYLLGISEMIRTLKPAKPLILDLSSTFGYEVVLRYITRSISARGHHVFNFYKMKRMLEYNGLFIEKSKPLQKIPHKVWNLTRNLTLLRLLVAVEKILKKTTPIIFSRAILLKCVKVS